MLLGFIAGGCTVNPVTGNNEMLFHSVDNDVKVGQQYAPEVQKQLYGRIENQNIQNYVNSVGQKIAKVSHMPELEFTYTAVNHDMVNAMALPGGYVFITRGLLEKLQTEAQLAAILAHETVHVTARHSESATNQQTLIALGLAIAMKDNDSKTVATVASVANQLIYTRYSRTHELEADEYGMDYMVKAGYDPKAIIETMQILKEASESTPIEFFSTHPNPENRAEMLTRHWNLKGYNYSTDGLRVGRNDYQANILGPLQSVPRVTEPPK